MKTDAIDQVIESPEFQAYLSRDEGWREHQHMLVMPPEAGELIEEYPDCDRQVLSRCEWGIDHFTTVGAMYWRLRSEGKSDSFAAMLALRRAPAVNTDDVFFHGLHHIGHQMPEEQAKQYVDAHINKYGSPPPSGSIYMPGLARFKGDREAFVSRSDGRTYIRRLIQQRGGYCDRDMNISWREPESDPLAPENCRPLGEDIIQRCEREAVQKNPDIARTPEKRRELRANIIAKHGPQS